MSGRVMLMMCCVFLNIRIRFIVLMIRLMVEGLLVCWIRLVLKVNW